MSFKEYLGELLLSFARNHTKTFLTCWLAVLVGCGVGSYTFVGYLADNIPGVKDLLTLLGIPALFGLVLLIMYIIWKIYKGISRFMEDSCSGFTWPWDNSGKGPFDY